MWNCFRKFTRMLEFDIWESGFLLKTTIFQGTKRTISHRQTNAFTHRFGFTPNSGDLFMCYFKFRKNPLKKITFQRVISQPYLYIYVTAGIYTYLYIHKLYIYIVYIRIYIIYASNGSSSCFHIFAPQNRSTDLYLGLSPPVDVQVLAAEVVPAVVNGHVGKSGRLLGLWGSPFEVAYMVVSKNRDTPKWMVYNEKPY